MLLEHGLRKRIDFALPRDLKSRPLEAEVEAADA